jgi:hypothetical protein
MANDGAVARLSGRFPPGTKVGLYRGRVDSVLRDDDLGGAFKTATVDKLGNVEFTGLDDDERLFIAGVVESEARPGEPSGTVHKDWRSVAIHASIPTTEKKLSEKEIQTALGSTLSAHEQEPDRTQVGARNSRSLSSQGQPFANTAVGKPTPGGPPQHPSPRLRQEDVDDVEQRTATITGGAFPVDPDEPVPAPKQDGPVDLEQRIATGSGQLHPIPDGEVQPGVPQEESVGREQRIATTEGTQFPLPEGDVVDHTRARDSSLSKVTGSSTPPVPVEEKPKRKRSQKGTRRSAKKGTAKRRGARSTSARKSKPRTEAQKKARRERDRKRRAK